MDEKQMRTLLAAIQRATLAKDCSKAGALAAAGLVMLNGTDSEASEAWGVVQELASKANKPS